MNNRSTPSSGNVFADVGLENPEGLLHMAQLGTERMQTERSKILRTCVSIAREVGIQHLKLYRGRVAGGPNERGNPWQAGAAKGAEEVEKAIRMAFPDEFAPG